MKEAIWHCFLDVRFPFRVSKDVLGVKKAIWHCFLDVRFPFRVSKDVLEKCWVSTVRFPLANSRVSLLPRDDQNVANRVRAFRRLPPELL